GTTGVPSVFYLDPGTVWGADKWITIDDFGGFTCRYTFDIPVPGFCSDPCDPDFEAELEGPEDLCIRNCLADEPETFSLNLYGGNWPYHANFVVQAPGYPTATFNDITIPDSYEFTVCVDSVSTITFNPLTRVFTVPPVAGNSVTLSVEVQDKWDCTAALDNEDWVISIN